jgi:hypothetical protein
MICKRSIAMNIIMYPEEAPVLAAFVEPRHGLRPLGGVAVEPLEVDHWDLYVHLLLFTST